MSLLVGKTFLLNAESLSDSATASLAVNLSRILRIFSLATEEAPSKDILMAWMSSASDGRVVDDDDDDERRGLLVDVAGGENASPCDDEES